MKEIENAYWKLKGLSTALGAIEVQAKKALIEFVKLYGKLELNTDGVPHTITDLSSEDNERHVIQQLEVIGDRLVVTTTKGIVLHQLYVFDDINYLLDDLSEECLEYANGAEETDGKHYAMVNVPGRHGYSFMVKTTEEMTEGEIISKCVGLDLFEDPVDTTYANVTPCTDDDIEKFSKDCTYDIDG
jgi:hypothetical protein